MTAPRMPRRRGFSSVELLIGLILIVASSSLLIGHVALRYGRDTSERNRVFAFMAAKSILAEVHAAVAAGQVVRPFDDGGTPYPTLGLARENETSIHHDARAVGGNFRRGGEWVWWREIEVRPMPGVDNRALRRVTVRVSKRDVKGDLTETATMSTVVTMRSTGFPTTQLFDLYLLAIENIPGRGVDMASMRPFVESEITDLERRNPGLEIRTHWITKSSYGRDPNYTPSIAPATGTRVYHYPFSAARAAGIKGRILVDGKVRNAIDPNYNPKPYALADGFNHGLRLPAERAFHQARLRHVRNRRRAIAAAKDRGASLPRELSDMSEEPTLRLLLEDLNTSPDRYRHALILNLHGDVLPMPAIRNYSDAASDPVALPNLRCVTHPEQLRTRRDPTGKSHASVVFRVYAYSDDPMRLPEGGVCPDNHAIALRVLGVDLTDPTRRGALRDGVELENLCGGVALVEPDTGRRDDVDYRPFAPAKDIHQRRDRHEMFYFAQFIDPGFGEAKYTLIWLFHTPVTCPSRRNSGSYHRDPLVRRGEPAPGTDRAPIRALPEDDWLPETSVKMATDPNKGRGQGLAVAARLYGLEYNPSPDGRDLATPGPGPKNTARWRLTLTGRLFEDQRFVTFAGEYYDPKADVRIDLKTSFWRVGDPEPASASTTHAWWAADPNVVPRTERAQFLGDPRHSPYQDVATGTGDFADGYNGYFGALGGADGYPAIDASRLANGWLGDHRCDVPRYLELLRDGLLRSGATFATFGSLSETRVLLGGEGEDGRMRLVARNRDHSSWWSRPWLGELVPDRPHTARGNLRAGKGPAAFSLRPAADLLAARSLGLSFARGSDAPFDWQSLFLAELDGRAFGLGQVPTLVTLSAGGHALARHYRTALPAAITAAGTIGWQPVASTPEWDLRPYRMSRCRARVLAGYYGDAASNTLAAGLVELIRGRDRARIFVDRTRGDVGTKIRRALLALLDAGAKAGVGLPPRLFLLAPTESDELIDPQSMRVRWEIRPGRWDGGDHAVIHSPEATENALVESDFEYTILYSSNAGRTWRYLDDDAPARPGARPSRAHLHSDAGPGPEEFSCPTPASRFPAGSYLLRVEVFSKGRPWHSAHHQRRIEIVR